SALFNEIDISNLSVAECSTRNINHSFQVRLSFESHCMLVRVFAHSMFYLPDTQCV
ncbi:diacylglycerol kinase delta-like isoform X11, partial [Biomphalaria glabrata]